MAVVTGGARGIGLAVARWFLGQGWRVALIDIDGDTLTRTDAALADPERVLAVKCDVSKPEQVAAAIAAVDARFGRIDALVNNAGVAVFKPILETSFEEWRHVLGTNLDGAFLCTQAAAPLMLRGGGGAVVNIASISGLRASTLRVAYGTSKGALIHLTKQQAIELGNAGIRVNCIAPGPVDTEMAKLVHSVAIRSDHYDTIPLNRYGTPEEIANAVGFLCSPAASYINGQVLAVDGGFDASGVGRRPCGAMPESVWRSGHRDCSMAVVRVGVGHGGQQRACVLALRRVEELFGAFQTTSVGRITSARAMPMRWRWPPEKACG